MTASSIEKARQRLLERIEAKDQKVLDIIKQHADLHINNTTTREQAETQAKDFFLSDEILGWGLNVLREIEQD